MAGTDGNMGAGGTVAGTEGSIGNCGNCERCRQNLPSSVEVYIAAAIQWS